MLKFVSKLGNAIVIAICVLCLAVLVPGFMGVKSYNVISGSMEPEISIGSLVYVWSVDFSELSKDDVIAFYSGDSVVTHRIVDIDSDSKLITTKGDANATNDINPVAYTNIIGKVLFHLPLIGAFAGFISTAGGKLVALLLIALGVAINLIAKKLQTIQPKPDGPFDTGVTIRRKKARKNNNSSILILIIGVLIIVAGVIGLTYIFTDYSDSNALYTKLNETYVAQTSTKEDTDFIEVDFEGLRAVNPDVIGWIYIEGTDVSYPIMYSGDDDKYLHTGFDGEYAKAGSIFLEGVNNTDFSDCHSIIYGHNMRNGSMFGSLKSYKADNSYIKEGHQYFQILLYDGTKLRYQIFSYFDTPADDWVYVVPYSEGNEYREYIDKLKKSSYQDLEVEVTASDRVVTLSTCSVEDSRFVINGVLIEKDH